MPSLPASDSDSSSTLRRPQVWASQDQTPAHTCVPPVPLQGQGKQEALHPAGQRPGAFPLPASAAPHQEDSSALRCTRGRPASAPLGSRSRKPPWEAPGRGPASGAGDPQTPRVGRLWSLKFPPPASPAPQGQLSKFSLFLLGPPPRGGAPQAPNAWLPAESLPVLVRAPQLLTLSF